MAIDIIGLVRFLPILIPVGNYPLILAIEIIGLKRFLPILMPGRV